MKSLIALYAAWLLACLTFLGSLYFSEILHLDPCNLCWYQRICLYPLVVILGMAIYNLCFDVIPYVIPQIGVGLMAAVYQVAIQANPQWQAIELCGAGPSCTEKIDIGLGVITLPMLSVCSSIVILGCLLYALRESEREFQRQFVYIRIK